MVPHDDNKLFALTKFKAILWKKIFWKKFFGMLYIELKLEDEI